MRALPLLAAGTLLAGLASASQTDRFIFDTQRAADGARATGVAVAPDGTLRPLPHLTQVAELEEPLGLALAVASDGTIYVGTGHPARIYRLTGPSPEMLAEVAADQITSLLLDADGTLYASTAVPALLVRLRPGSTSPEVVGTLGEGNIWDLARFRGEIVAAAGNPGRLLRLTPKGLALIAAVPDQHARCLAVAGNTLLIGTSGKGLILSWDGKGPLGALYDSDFTEIAALAAAPDGTIWASGLTGDPSLGTSPPGADDSATAVVTTDTSSSTKATTSQGSGSSATSEILHVYPSGAALVAHRFDTQIADTLCWGEDGLVIGTALEGELWQLTDGGAARLDAVDAAQIVRLAAGGDVVLTQGPVRVYRRQGTPGGSFTSPVLDADQPAHFGQVRVRSTGSCTLSFRSGATETPDETWSEWTSPVACSADGSATVVPPARYLQWKLSLEGERTSASRVDVAYRQVNLPPRIASVTVHAPAEIFLKSPPPSDRIVEVNHPEPTGIFTTIGDDGDRDPSDQLGKLYYRVGYRSVSWKADDPNDDPLRFELDVRREGEEHWWPVRKDLETVVLGVDTQALPEGAYRFRVIASDATANPGDAATETALSSWFVVDNTPPRVTVTRDGDFWVATVEDALSPVSSVEWNRDADEWHAAAPEDGLVDGRKEVFRIPAAGGRHLLSIRADDDHFNRATIAVEEGR